MKRLRPLEWAVLAFLFFVLVRAGPSVFFTWKVLGGRALKLLFALGLVSGIQALIRQSRIPWATSVDARLKKAISWTLPLALLPFFFTVSVMLRSPVVQEELPLATPAEALTAVASMFMLAVGFGLPTFFIWLLVARVIRERGSLSREGVRNVLTEAGSIFRDWFPLLVVFSGYEWMRAVVDAGFTGEKDTIMQRIDRALFFGHDPLDFMESIRSTPLNEVLAFFYSFYAVLFPLVLGTILLTSGRHALRMSAFRVGVALLIAYVGYCLVPVKGPLFTRAFDVPLDLYLVGPIKEAMMDATRISYDCFPSMHTCCTLLLGACAWRWSRKLFWVLSPIIVSMPFACVYLRYHYVIDVLVGAALVPLIIWASNRLASAISPTTE